MQSKQEWAFCHIVWCWGYEAKLKRRGNISKLWTSYYNDVIMGTMASQFTSLTIVYLTVYSGPDKRKHQSSASLAFVRGIHRRSVNSPHKGPVMQKMFPFDDVIMSWFICWQYVIRWNSFILVWNEMQVFLFFVKLLLQYILMKKLTSSKW